MNGLLGFLQSASNTAANTVSGPVDLIAAGLRKVGVPIPEDPVAGANWMKHHGLLRDVPDGPAKVLGETAGMLTPALAMQYAPQIASVANKAISNAMAPTSANKELGAIVWHGSPHKFDRFDSSKIGTGEGAQAYGHGLYLAESPDVAKMYQEKLTDPAFKYAGMNEAKARLNEKIAKRIEATDPARAAKLRSEVASLSDPGGALYKVDLPDDAIAKMLDWDKPLSQQAPEVRQALKSMTDDVLAGGFDISRAARNPKLAFDDSARGVALDTLKSKYGVTENAGKFFDKSGRPISAEAVEKQIAKMAGKGYEKAGDLYSDLAHIVGSQADVSSVMRNQGIPGIRYLDGGSRGTGAGTSNFVVFPGNESILSILERNSQALK